MAPSPSVEIRTWLNGPRDYAAGVALYARLGTNGTLRRLFDRGETAYTRGKLLTELQALVQPTVSASPQAPTTPAKAVQVATAPPTPGTELTEEQRRTIIRSYAAARQPLFDERRMVHAQLSAVATFHDRNPLGHRILVLSDRITESYRREAHELAHGPERAAEPAAGLTKAELTLQRQRLSSRRSKLRKNPGMAAEVDRLSREIDLINEQIQSTQTQ